MSRAASWAALAALTVLLGCGGGAEPDTAEVHDDEHAGEHTEPEGGSAQVTLSEAAARTAGITVRAATLESEAEPAALEVPGRIEFDPRRIAVISSRIPGRVERLAAVEGEDVRAGETVAQLYSAEYLTAQSDFVQASRRAERLVGTADEPGARSLAEAARERLRRLGAAPSTIDRLADGGAIEPTLGLRAPFGGSLLESHVLPGEAVEPGAPIFRLADLSVVDVIAAVPERSLPLVRVGQQAEIVIAAYPEMSFTGKVERLREQIDPETRTIQAVIHAPNAQRYLRPGMYATVRLATGAEETVARRTAAAAPDSLLTIPEAAVVTDGDDRIVFVEVAQRTYERRVVEVVNLTPPGSTTPTADRVAVRSGLRAGERIVVQGAFTLKSELAKGGLSHDH
jgi:multidrug efflux pump subunit AcrA (membrane-fusion protein)